MNDEKKDGKKVKKKERKRNLCVQFGKYLQV